MNPLKATMQQAVAGMELQSKRMGITSENISNADTPGYHRKMLIVSEAPTFSEQMMATVHTRRQPTKARQLNDCGSGSTEGMVSITAE